MPQSQESNLITISKIPQDVQKTIRNSFSYQGLVKALNAGIISQDDIQAEADFEQKNPDLLMDQRVHTILLADIKQGQVKKNLFPGEPEDSAPKKDTTKPILLRREEAQMDSEEQLDPASELEESLGFKITPGFKGLDANGNFLEIINIDDFGWIKFCSFNKNYQTECFSYPLIRFIKYFQDNNIFEIQDEDFDLVQPEKIKNLADQQRTQLLKKIYERALAKLRDLKIKKRSLLEKIIHSREDKKLKEILAQIKA